MKERDEGEQRFDEIRSFNIRKATHGEEQKDVSRCFKRSLFGVDLRYDPVAIGVSEEMENFKAVIDPFFFKQ